MGDVISLVERAQQQFDEEESRKMQKKIAKNTFWKCVKDQKYSFSSKTDLF